MKAPDAPRLRLAYVDRDAIGYGRLGREIHKALTHQGVHVDFQSNVERADMGGSNVVCWVSYPSHAMGWLEGQIPTCFTMFETDYLPEAFRENFHAFDTIIVPSEQNLELFSQYHGNVKKVALGVDPEKWHFTERPAVGRYFRFLHAGSGERKGQDVAHKAFLAAFPEGSWGDGPIPYMTFKSPRGMMDGLHLSDRMECITGHVSPEEEVGLYEAAHCFVMPSRGEGFGLQPLQAMAQGCPTILTDAHGHAEFAGLAMGIGAEKVPAGYFIHGNHPEMCWWEPDFDEVVDRMRWVYEEYRIAEALAESKAAEVAKRFTWNNTATHFLDAIGRDRLLPYTGNGTWYEPESMLYKVRVDREIKHFEVAGRSLRMVPGQDYWETADVKRILFENGSLDPSCLDEIDGRGTGLLESQEATLAEYRATKSHCHACGQRLPEAVA